ncbi:uncharacterized protein [Arachis hypogaea]|uniref:uncharacterized protein isoform X3 n=1 Tax=Arachis hypogaea TaxID=3818 RepID=UPI0010FC4B1E|nr:U4/U6.U5 tri-snRNP-associated protein 2 isoform X1 [Arachis hypogaea]
MPIHTALKQDTMFISISKLRKSTVYPMDMKLMIIHWMTFIMSLIQGLLQRMLSYLTKISSGLGHLMVLVTFLEWVGLNNIKETDFVNVTIQSLMRVTPLRNLFLIPENYQHCKSPLVHRFGELTRKIWHSRNFKGLVSPHEFLQAVMKASKKRFHIGAQSDPIEFMSWLLNTLHADLKSSKKNTSIIYDCFQGELEVAKEIPNKSITDKKENCEDLNKNEKNSDGATERDAFVKETSKMPFLMLGLDLPPPPVLKDVMEKNIILQSAFLLRTWS